MKRTITQPCVVLGSTDRATLFRDELHRRGVRFISYAPSVGRLRRQLVLGEDAAVIMCVLLSVDDLTPIDRQQIARLLDDRQGFATRVFCIGIVHESESFARWAPLGCDAYVSTPRAAMDAIRAHVQSAALAGGALTAQQLLRSAPVPSLQRDALAARAVTETGATSNLASLKQATRARTVISTNEPRTGGPPPT